MELSKKIGRYARFTEQRGRHRASAARPAVGRDRQFPKESPQGWAHLERENTPCSGLTVSDAYLGPSHDHVPGDPMEVERIGDVTITEFMIQVTVYFEPCEAS